MEIFSYLIFLVKILLVISVSILLCYFAGKVLGYTHLLSYRISCMLKGTKYDGADFVRYLEEKKKRRRK